MEPRAVTVSKFENTSVPMFNATAKKASSLLERVRPRWGGGRVGEVIDVVKSKVERVEELTRETSEAFDMFRPFTVENAYVFRSENVRSLFDRISEDEQSLLTWNPEKLDWYHYWLDVHLPGLTKWVFPTLEDEMRAQPKRVYTYRDLLELFETSTKRHATRVAMRIERDGRKEQYTYADLRELATRVAGFLASHGIKGGDRVMLVSANAPEWGMTYFGVLKAGATCIPCDPESSTNEILNFARAGNAAAIITSELVLDEHPDLRERLQQETTARLWTYTDVFEMPDEQTEDERIALLPQRVHAQSVASLIFTSGTTGQPKGVMLSHRNLTSMVSMLSSVFDMSISDGVLSGLPLHHTFEFSTGFLTPLSRGAQITYLPELTSDALARAIKTGTSRAWSACRRCGSCCTVESRTGSTSAATGSARLPRTLSGPTRGCATRRRSISARCSSIRFTKDSADAFRYFISGGSALE
jgi:long-chain acyl-CoA synthetase